MGRNIEATGGAMTGPDPAGPLGAVLVDPATRPTERWADPAHGTIGWQTLLSAGLTTTNGLTCGIAVLEPGEHFALHSHPDPELYLALEGIGTVIVDGIPQVMLPEMVLFIPGGAVHGIPAVTTRFRYFYCFAADSFTRIAYDFAAAAIHMAAAPHVQMTPVQMAPDPFPNPTPPEDQLRA